VIGLPESQHMSKLSARGNIGRKSFIDEDNQQLKKAHSSVLQQLTITYDSGANHDATPKWDSCRKY
jgi:hypothetical protein